MNDKQKRFAEFYAQTANATEAARAAGYSEKTARSQGQRLLTNADISDYIHDLQEQAASGRIATMTQTKAFWSDVMNDSTERTADRLKASELLAKSAGAFLHVGKNGNGEDALVFGEADAGDVIIYMPAIRSEHECEVPPEEEN